MLSKLKPETYPAYSMFSDALTGKSHLVKILVVANFGPESRSDIRKAVKAER